FSVGDRPGFIEPVNERGIFGIGPALLRASTHAQISVGEREHGFRLGQKFGVKRLLDDVPLVGRIVMGRRPEPFMMEHRALSPTTARGVGRSTSSPRFFRPNGFVPDSYGFARIHIANCLVSFFGVATFCSLT